MTDPGDWPDDPDAPDERNCGEMWPGANDLPYVQDIVCQLVMSSGDRPYRPRSLDEIACYLGISKQAVADIEKRALRKLFAAMARF